MPITAALLRRISEDNWALVPLRVMVGLGFVAHGYAKLDRGVGAFARVLAGLGIPAPDIMAWVTTLLELVGGAALAAGALVVPLSLPLVVTMLTAIFAVHLRYGFSSIRLKALTATGAEFGPPGYELALFYVVALVTLAVSRPTPISVDRWRAQRRG